MLRVPQAQDQSIETSGVAQQEESETTDSHAVLNPASNEPSPHEPLPIPLEHPPTGTAPESYPATATSIQNLSPDINPNCQFANTVHTPVLPESVPPAQAHIAAPAPTLNNDGASQDGEDADEMAFFLRQFSEGVGKAMDLVTSDCYFSRQAVHLAVHCPLIKYSACAAAAKQIGQTGAREPARTRLTAGQIRVADAISKTNLDYLWYGAKYYEKAIQALAREISQESLSSPSAGLATCSGLAPSPSAIYGAVVADSGHEMQQPAFPLVAACILCQYEELSATMRAWSGHLDGICKLLQIDGKRDVERSPPSAARA
ncbi:hypothetical protein SLS58_010425 [Diplodia intermedia]|uniref:Uncharacterized protein n=1 Tax=Diplodia intermedia TaxID=856260 RepID=A0ABR3T633_9PEZI